MRVVNAAAGNEKYYYPADVAGSSPGKKLVVRQNMTNNNNFKSIFYREPNYQNCPSGLCTGADGGFCDREGPRGTVLSGNMDAMAPIGTANGALFWGVSGAYPSEKIFEIEVL